MVSKLHGYEIDAFTQAYLEAALWTETDGDGDPLDRNHDIRSFAPEAIWQAVEDCAMFWAEHGEIITEDNLTRAKPCGAIEYAGHDFWLTRQDCGCGFWDGDWRDEVGAQLTEGSKRFGALYPYVGDDGLIYFG